jgi:hypothetical protein
MFVKLTDTQFVRARAISSWCVDGPQFPPTDGRDSVYRYHIVLRDAPPVDFTGTEPPDAFMARLNATPDKPPKRKDAQ